jgi:hypothetical protein
MPRFDIVDEIKELLTWISCFFISLWILQMQEQNIFLIPYEKELPKIAE